MKDNNCIFCNMDKPLTEGVDYTKNGEVWKEHISEHLAISRHSDKEQTTYNCVQCGDELNKYGDAFVCSKPECPNYKLLQLGE